MTIEATVLAEPRETVVPETAGYLTRKEAATRCRVPLSTFDSLRRQNRFPFPDAHMGKHMLWRASTVDDFLEAGGTRADG